MNKGKNKFFHFKSNIMKKIFYFLVASLGLISVSCSTSKVIYDDVYDQAEYNPVEVNNESGYDKYIKDSENTDYEVIVEEKTDDANQTYVSGRNVTVNNYYTNGYTNGGF